MRLLKAAVIISCLFGCSPDPNCYGLSLGEKLRLTFGASENSTRGYAAPTCGALDGLGVGAHHDLLLTSEVVVKRDGCYFYDLQIQDRPAGLEGVAYTGPFSDLAATAELETPVSMFDNGKGCSGGWALALQLSSKDPFAKPKAGEDPPVLAFRTFDPAPGSNCPVQHCVDVWAATLEKL